MQRECIAQHQCCSHELMITQVNECTADEYREIKLVKQRSANVLALMGILLHWMMIPVTVGLNSLSLMNFLSSAIIPHL